MNSADLLELSPEEQATCIAAGIDPDNAFVRAAWQQGWRPPAPKLPDDHIKMLCPIESGHPYPGPPCKTLPDADARPVQDAFEYRIGGKYPFADMAVGDSFYVHPTLNSFAVRSAANYFSALHGTRFSFRRGRCWRLA